MCSICVWQIKVMNKTKHFRVIAFLAVLSLIFGGVSPAIGQVVSSGFVSPLSMTSSGQAGATESSHCDEHRQEARNDLSLDALDIGSLKIAAQSSELEPNNGNLLSDCCEDLCFCSQGGCHQSLNAFIWNDLSLPDLSDHSHSLTMSFYKTPSFDNSNPPPIS